MVSRLSPGRPGRAAARAGGDAGELIARLERAHRGLVEHQHDAAVGGERAARVERADRVIGAERRRARRRATATLVPYSKLGVPLPVTIAA